MATAEFSATVGAVASTAQAAGAVTTVTANALTAQTDSDTAVADMTTAAADIDLVATTASNGIIALLGSGSGSGPITYSTTTKQYTGAANTSTTVTQAQANALVALLNTMGAAFVTAQNDLTTLDAAVDAVVAAAPSADLTLYIGNTGNVVSMDKFNEALSKLQHVVAGTKLFAVGSGTPRARPEFR